LHGYPRTKAQADALQRAGIIADVFLLLDVPDALLVERIVGRRVDPITNEIYHMKTRPPPSKAVEQRCLMRADDTEDAIKVRIAKYHQHVADVRKFFGVCLSSPPVTSIIRCIHLNSSFVFMNYRKKW
jgi:adenylate kinase